MHVFVSICGSRWVGRLTCQVFVNCKSVNTGFNSKLINPEHIHTEFTSSNKHMHSLGRQFYMEAVEEN